jgi:hypothetical protein
MLLLLLLLLLVKVLLYEPCMQHLASAQVLLRLLLLPRLQLCLLAVALLHQGPCLQHLQHLRSGRGNCKQDHASQPHAVLCTPQVGPGKKTGKLFNN